MTAYQIFQELSSESWWAERPVRVRWLAARLYAGVDRIEDLRRLSQPQVVSENLWGDKRIVPPAVSKEDVDLILQLW